MTSVLKVDNIQNSSGTDAISIDSSGNVGIGTTQINSDGTWGKAPAGTVLQVKQASYTGAYSSTSTSYTTISGLSVTITPRSSTSKFLVMYHVSGNANTRYWSLVAYRDSTAINRGGGSGNRERISTPTGANNSEDNQWHVQRSVADAYLDSPNTTSAITYTVRGRIHYNSGTFYINRDQYDDNYSYAKRASSNLIVMEIAG